MESTTDFEKLLFLYKTEGKNRTGGTQVSVSAKKQGDWFLFHKK